MQQVGQQVESISKAFPTLYRFKMHFNQLYWVLIYIQQNILILSIKFHDILLMHTSVELPVQVSIQNISIAPCSTLVSLGSQSPCQLWNEATTSLLSVTIDQISFPRILHKWNHPVYTVCSQLFCVCIIIFLRFICCCIFKYLIPCYC